MATRVRLVVEYDLDLEPDQEATPAILAKELGDWLGGRITLEDVVVCEGPEAITLTVKE